MHGPEELDQAFRGARAERAEALGLTMPPTFLFQANEVIR
jgi:hypothetical protein